MSNNFDSLNENKQTGKWFSSDDIFNSLYPPHIEAVAQKHWTPLAVAEKQRLFWQFLPGESFGYWKRFG